MSEKTYRVGEVECPYCGYTQDGWLFDDPGHYSCDECGKDFLLAEIQETITYITEKISP